MNIKTKSILIGIAGAALFFIGGMVLIAKKGKSYTTHFKVQVNPAPAITLTHEALMDIMKNLITERAKAARFSSDIKKNDSKVMEVTFKEVKDTALANRILVFKDILVEFRETYNLLELSHLPAKINEVGAKYTSSSEKREGVKETQPVTISVDTALSTPVLHKYESPEVRNQDGEVMIDFAKLNTGAGGRTSIPFYIGSVSAKDTAIISRILHDSDLVKSMLADTRFYYGLPYWDVKNDDLLLIYAIATKGHKTALLRNEDIRIASVQMGQTGQPEIILQFNSIGTRKWAMMTSRNIDRCIAIIVNDVVISAPVVLGSIEEGTALLSGGRKTTGELQDLANQLNSGTLPATLTILDHQIVEEKVMFSSKFLLFIAGVLIIVSGISYLIIKSLKTS